MLNVDISFPKCCGHWCVLGLTRSGLGGLRSLSDKQRVRAAREMRSQGVIGGAMKRRWDGEGSEEERGQM